MSSPRSNPSHWVWTVDAPPRFTPDVDAYAVIHDAMSDAQVWQVTQLFAEGMSAERVVALFGIDGMFPPEVVQLIGNALAFWAQVQAVEEGIDA